jgi:peptide/nickel transport system substrate-binding protein
VNIQAKQVADLLYDKLAEIGPAMNTFGDEGFEPRLAERWAWSADSLAITFRLDPRAHWHDGRPVTARDVRFTMELAMDSTAGAANVAQLSVLDSVTTPDSLTAVFWFAHKYPEQFFDATFHTPILPAHLLAELPRATLMSSEAARQPVGSGPYRLVHMEPGQHVELAADSTYYRGRPGLARVVVRISPDPVAAATRLFAGEADLYEAIRVEHMGVIGRTPALRVVTTPSTLYGFLQFNLVDPKRAGRPHPLFGDRELRRALTMAVDRAAIVHNVFDTLAYLSRGPFTRVHATADTTVAMLPFDTVAAARALDALGWRDTNGDGVRERAGRELAFSIIVPSTSTPRQRSAVLLQEQFARVGAKVAVERLELNAALARLGTGDFDGYMGAWVTDASPSGARETWGGESARRKGGLNYGRYSNPRFDAALDSGRAAPDSATRRRYFRRAYDIIAQDAPAIWLFEPKTVIGIHRRFETPSLRPYAWWTDIPAWTVPVARRLERDRATPAQPTL